LRERNAERELEAGSLARSGEPEKGALDVAAALRLILRDDENATTWVGGNMTPAPVGAGFQFGLRIGS
jgi:hypothetical protein